MTLAVLGVVALATLWFVTSRVRRRRAPAPKKVRPGTLLLEANAWERCSVDGVREPWARYTTEPVRGFGGVPAGRRPGSAAPPHRAGNSAVFPWDSPFIAVCARFPGN